MKVIQKGSNCLDVLMFQYSMGIGCDGIFGSKTENIVKEYQEKIGDDITGKVSGYTWNHLFQERRINPTEEDYKALSKKLGIEVECIKAVEKVESGKDAFLKSGYPTMLFEAHIFYKYLKTVGGKNPELYIKSHPGILSKTWDRKLYKGGELEYNRLMEAWGISKEASLLSASYGAFQICGFNYKSCGCSNVFEFVGKMGDSKKTQLELFGNFLKNTGKIKFLKEHNWAGFAQSYNGSGYKSNNYDKKLENSYNFFKNSPN